MGLIIKYMAIEVNFDTGFESDGSIGRALNCNLRQAEFSSRRIFMSIFMNGLDFDLSESEIRTT